MSPLDEMGFRILGEDLFGQDITLRRRLGKLGGGGLLPYAIDFDRYPDGNLPAGWIAPNGSIVGGKLVIMPTKGAEELTNSSFTAWTADNPDNWTVANENANNYITEFTGKARLVSNNTAAIQMNQAGTTGVGHWMDFSIDLVSLAAGTLRIQLQRTSFGANKDVTDIATHSVTGLVTSVSARPVIIRLGTCDYIVDNASLKPLTQSTLLAYRNLGNTNQNVSATFSDYVIGTQLGTLANVAADASAGLVAFTDGFYVHLWKWVGTTWTALISNGAFANDGSSLPQILTERSGADLLATMKYKGSVVGTQQTVSDAEIIDSVWGGVFSTHSGNKLITFEAAAN